MVNSKRSQARSLVNGPADSLKVRRDDVVVFDRGVAGAGVYAELALESGRSFTINDTWDQKDDQGQQVPPGKYHIHVFLTSATLNNVPVPYGTLSADPVEVTIR